MSNSSTTSPVESAITELSVDLGERSYPIYIGAELLQKPELLTAKLKGRQVCVVTNSTIAPLYLARLEESLAAYQLSVVVLPDGEQYKTLDVLNQIYDTLLQDGHNRTTCLVALGGGVVGDMTGYAAASYQRGVEFIQVPTTLLSMVDSSVGGKTGVNHPLGKNMIGAFHQPQVVIADTSTLATLPERELAAGIAEVIKYGLICDADFFNWLEDNIDGLNNRDAKTLQEAVRRSCENKAAVVAEDERESGRRAILNLGHTFGHAIETAQGYGNWLHGEAVGAGMMLAIQLSARLGWLSAEEVSRSENLIKRAKLPLRPPSDMTTAQFLSLMSKDKKVVDGSLRLVLLKGIGNAVVTGEIATAEIIATLEEAGVKPA